MFPQDDTRVDINSPINEEIRRLASKGNDQIIEDLHRRLSPLPDVLFPCQACRQEWLTASEAPWVLWFTVIALLTVYRASYPVVARVMDWMEPENKRIYERVSSFDIILLALIVKHTDPRYFNRNIRSSGITATSVQYRQPAVRRCLPIRLTCQYRSKISRVG